MQGSMQGSMGGSMGGSTEGSTGGSTEGSMGGAMEGSMHRVVAVGVPWLRIDVRAGMCIDMGTDMRVDTHALSMCGLYSYGPI